METNELKFCKECRWLEVTLDPFPECKCPRVERDVDLVTGKAEKLHASTARLLDRLCGVNGKYYEEK